MHLALGFHYGLQQAAVVMPLVPPLALPSADPCSAVLLELLAGSAALQAVQSSGLALVQAAALVADCYEHALLLEVQESERSERSHIVKGHNDGMMEP